ncbi:PAS domain-containing protein [Caenimonas sedimenti]|uniref:PAS domain-containing protein n=1 Tax=Caenimonas sedimenti TaxID=2596921 RepID=A0A562ZNC7_9BURK|nr:PAS domain-containing protein [Caenimonas sedimenti]TWO70089.1 PAS domain-containing protein [Caenimonas sedimenti]
MKTDIAEVDARLQRTLADVFGSSAGSIADVEQRALALFDPPVIVWEGDPDTFQFTYVSKCAEDVLGYPVSRWLELGFWAHSVVHPDDQTNAVAFCALATAKGRDHDFQYRATCADGRVVVLHDMVHVIKGPLKVPIRLRGVMTLVATSEFQEPSRSP